MAWQSMGNWSPIAYYNAANHKTKRKLFQAFIPLMWIQYLCFQEAQES